MCNRIIKPVYLLAIVLIAGVSCSPKPAEVTPADLPAQVAPDKTTAMVLPLGHVKEEAEIRNGFGFAVKGYGIITCAHIAARDTMLFQPVTSTTDFKMVLTNKLEAFDLAAYRIIGDTAVAGYDIGDFAGIHPYDTVIYFGWEPAKLPKLKIIHAVVAATGHVARQNESLDFIDFSGIMKPGYSGGPVLDNDGKIIALASECAIVKGFRGSIEETIIRAFSLEPLQHGGTASVKHDRD